MIGGSCLLTVMYTAFLHCNFTLTILQKVYVWYCVLDLYVILDLAFVCAHIHSVP